MWILSVDDLDRNVRALSTTSIKLTSSESKSLPQSPRVFLRVQESSSESKSLPQSPRVFLRVQDSSLESKKINDKTCSFSFFPQTDSSGVERTSPGRLSFGDGEVGGLSPCGGGSPGSLKVPGAVAASSGGLGRIARLLVKDATRTGEDSYRRRTHSLESKNGAPPLRRAASIDSLVDTNASCHNNNNINNNNTAKTTSVLSMTKSNGHLRSYLPVSPALYKRPSFKFDKTPASTGKVFLSGYSLG
ncbi:uncharacterized protein [Procambarus clarkii]|uniref:uncharacterized protein n=1 Tax=Procambarus clarkii TaxID=6728 RepID=UPI0037426788